MPANGGVDLVEEALPLVDDERLGELFAAAELLVEGLAADAGGTRDVGHRDLRPGAALQLVAGSSEQGLAQQLARGLRVGRAGGCHGRDRLSGSGHLTPLVGLEVDLVAHAAVGAGPVIGDLAPGRAGGKPLAGVTLLLVVDVPARWAAPTAHVAAP